MDEQSAICDRFGVPRVAAPPEQMVGIARNVREGLRPINGLRIRPEGNSCGWFIWAGGEMSSDPDFFVPLHVRHLDEWCPGAVKFLNLPPGWRFLFDGDYVDAWQDAALLDG